jgi:hypothetical protein
MGREVASSRRIRIVFTTLTAVYFPSGSCSSNSGSPSSPWSKIFRIRVKNEGSTVTANPDNRGGGSPAGRLNLSNAQPFVPTLRHHLN